MLNVILIMVMPLLAVVGVALIYGGQYLYKEKFIKSGLREGLHNTSISDYPENKKGKKLLLIGQICIGIDILLALILLVK